MQGLLNARPALSSCNVVIARNRPTVDATVPVLAAVAFIVAFDNDRLWSTLLGLVDPAGGRGWAPVAAIAAFVAASIATLLAPFSHPRTVKPAVCLLLLVAAFVSWFQDSMGTIIDDAMVRSALETDLAESRELVTAPFLAHMAIYGLLPAAFAAWPRVRPRPSVLRGLLVVLATSVAAVSVMLAAFWIGYKPITVINRQHTELRMLVNPVYALYSAVEAITDAVPRTARPRLVVGADAVSAMSASGKPRVVVVVVGETARADHFAVNGYGRPTTPRLAASAAMSFADTVSCGTSTTVSVPCLFSPLDRHGYDRDARTDNLLHVVRRAGIDVLWRDNNTGCKDVCDGFDYVSYRNATDPSFCDADGCVDAILLEGLEEEILSRDRDLLVVLHQNGSHGPAYYRRYPAGFGVFAPECRSESPWECSTAELSNSYDNSILYTDYFLSRVIGLLSSLSQARETSMLYVSDHGESLGENGLYLHGLPYAIAPDSQTHVPMILWRGGGADTCVRERAREPASHDNVFHTVLGMLGVATQARDDRLDLLAGCRHTALVAAGEDAGRGVSSRHAALVHSFATHPQVR